MENFNKLKQIIIIFSFKKINEIRKMNMFSYIWKIFSENITHVDEQRISNREYLVILISFPEFHFHRREMLACDIYNCWMKAFQGKQHTWFSALHSALRSQGWIIPGSIPANQLEIRSRLIFIFHQVVFCRRTNLNDLSHYKGVDVPLRGSSWIYIDRLHLALKRPHL